MRAPRARNPNGSRGARDRGVRFELVTLDEAIAELRIDRNTSPDEARRAYLRLLKQRKPEVDPEGFQRLREAYELLRNSLAWRHATAGRAPESGPPSPVANAPVPARSPTLPPEGEVTAGEAPAGETTDGPAPDPDLERLDEIGRLMRAKETQAAANLLAEHYEFAAARPGIAVPPPPATLDLLLRAHEQGWLPVAARLERAFALWLEAVGAEVRVLGGAAPQWAIARELGGLPRALSPEVRTTLARAARTGELALGLASLRDIGAFNPSEGRRNARILRVEGRAFSSKAAAVLAPPRWGRGGIKAEWRGRMIALSIAASALLRIAQCATQSDAPVTRASSARAATAPPPFVQVAGESANLLAKHADDVGEGLVGDRARAVRAALWEDDCPEALSHLTALQATPMSPDLAARCAKLGATVTLACGGGHEAGP
jgi:hypothetical protein